MDLLTKNRLDIKTSLRILQEIPELSTFYIDLHFLVNRVTKKKPFVVSINPSSIAHYELLSRMFPNVTFHVWNPLVFHESDSKRIKLYSNMPNAQDLERKYSRKEKYLGNTYLISHLDSGRDASFDELEEYNLSDLQDQNAFCRAVSFVDSSLRFRLPIPSEEYKQVSYLSGCVYTIPYKKTTSLDLILYPSKNDDKWEVYDYNVAEYAERMTSYKNKADYQDQLLSLIKEYLKLFEDLELEASIVLSSCLKEINKQVIRQITLNGYVEEDENLLKDVVPRSALPSLLERSRAYINIASDIGDVTDL